MTTPKLVAAGGLPLSVSVPVEQWGKDHWSCLAFIEYLCVDYHGRLDDKRRRSLRCNPRTHPGYSLNFSYVLWKPEYGSRLKGYWRPDKSVDESRRILDHDDWDCIEDFEAAGVLTTEGSGLNPVFKLTRLGLALAAALRAHKANGGHFATFSC